MPNRIALRNLATTFYTYHILLIHHAIHALCKYITKCVPFCVKYLCYANHKMVMDEPTARQVANSWQILYKRN